MISAFCDFPGFSGSSANTFATIAHAISAVATPINGMLIIYTAFLAKVSDESLEMELCAGVGAQITSSPRCSLFTSRVAGFGCHMEMLTQAFYQSIQTVCQLEPPALDGKVSEFLHGLLESLQGIRRVGLQRIGG